MSDITINMNPTTEAEYKAACQELLLEMQQHEEKFDRLHAQFVANHEAAERRAVRSAALTEEINRMMQKLWGTK